MVCKKIEVYFPDTALTLAQAGEAQEAISSVLRRRKLSPVLVTPVIEPSAPLLKAASETRTAS